MANPQDLNYKSLRPRLPRSRGVSIAWSRRPALPRARSSLSHRRNRLRRLHRGPRRHHAFGGPAASFPANSAPAAKEARPDLESRIGQVWLNRIGIVAVLFGVAYFLKYAFDNDWIGAGGRVAIGMLAGIGLILWSESFRRKGHAPFSYSLKAVGLGILYLALWAAFQTFHLIPSQVAFAAMVIVTASAIVMAVSQDAQLLATFALIGGFITRNWSGPEKTTRSRCFPMSVCSIWRCWCFPASSPGNCSSG